MPELTGKTEVLKDLLQVVIQLLYLTQQKNIMMEINL